MQGSNPPGCYKVSDPRPAAAALKEGVSVARGELERDGTVSTSTWGELERRLTVLELALPEPRR